jgi:hypothetical protein
MRGAASRIERQRPFRGRPRVGNPLLTHVLFPTYVAALLWGGLVLRDATLRSFTPWWRQS